MQYEKRLRQLRIEKGYSEERLAKILHIDVEVIKKWERGQAEPTFRELEQLSALYSLEVDEILENASQYLEIEQAIEYTPDNQKRYVVGATGTNRDDIESLYYHDIDALKASIAAKKESDRVERGGQTPPPKVQKGSEDGQTFWARVLFYMAVISLTALLPMLLTKNRFWAFLALLPVAIFCLLATLKKSKKLFITVGFATLFSLVIILIAVAVLR